MKKTRIALSSILVLLAFAVAGCFPTKRIVWSPDGKQAAILGECGLYLSDPDGHISEPLLSNVVAVSWFPDSRRLALVQKVKSGSWVELQPLLATETRDRIKSKGQAVIEKLKAGVAFDQAYAAPQSTGDDNNLVALYLRGIEDVKALAGDHWTNLETSEMEPMLLVASVAGGKLTAGKPLAAIYVDTSIQPLISRDGNTIAFISGPTLSLCLVPADGSTAPKFVADFVAVSPDWSLDGRALVYLHAIEPISEKGGGGELHLGALARHPVINQTGQIEIQPKGDDLAGLLFNPWDKVRCLRDGRIIFSALSVHLPVTKADMPQREQLFALDPDRQSTLTPLIPQGVQGQIPENVSVFEVSPDEKLISFLGDKGAVSILTIGSGEVEVVQAPIPDNGKGNEYDTVPVWRTTNELSFIYREPSTNNVPNADQMAIWSNGKARVISGSWSPEVRKSWLDKN